MKKIVWICFVFLVSFPLQGQSPEVAKKLLDDVSETIASFENLSFDFSYVLENRQENIRQETKDLHD